MVSPSTGAGLPAGSDISSLPPPSPEQPLLAPLQGRGWATSEVFGIAPDPTAIATLGVLLLARGRLLPLLVPIPILWCLLSGMTLSTMGEPQAWGPYAALALTTAAWTWTIIRRHFNR